MVSLLLCLRGVCMYGYGGQWVMVLVVGAALVVVSSNGMGYDMPCICHGVDGLTHGLMAWIYTGN